MKRTPILKAAKGLDLLSPETTLPEGALRTADNITLDHVGGAKRRDGYAIDLSLADASSLYVATQYRRPLTLVKAGTTLYELTGKVGSLAVTSLATGLAPGYASYAEIASSVYVSAGKLLRLDPDGIARTPGVVAMIGLTPGLTSTTGGLAAGQYGVAVSAIAASGEESGLSNMATITLAAAGGINVNLAGFPTASIVRYRIYRTEQNGDLLYLDREINVAGSVNLLGGNLGPPATNWLLDQLPPGKYIAAYNGRLYSLAGGFLYYSDVYNPGLYNPRSCWIPLEGDGTGLIAMDTGLYVGTTAGVIFLQGGGPADFQLLAVTSEPMIDGTAIKAPADLFAAELLQGTKKDVALWLSGTGYVVGLNGGQVLAPQSERIRIDAVRGSTATFRRDGVQQVVTAVEEVTLGSGGAADSTP
jgi:hypothetical protein